MACHYTFAARLVHMLMAQFHEIFVPVVRRSARGREMAIVVRHAPIADDFGLAEGERAGLLTCRHTIA